MVEVIHVIFSEEQLGVCRGCALPRDECSRPLGAAACRASRLSLSLFPQEPSRSQPGRNLLEHIPSQAVELKHTGVRVGISRKAALLFRV